MARLIWALFFLATLISLGLFVSVELGPRTRPIETTPLQGGDYHAPLPADPSSLDPALATDSTSVWCVLQMFDGLVRFQASQEDSVGPAIATSWSVSFDQKEYTFHLRNDVRFHAAIDPQATGRPSVDSVNRGRIVTSGDFKYSFERVLRKETASPRTGVFEFIEGARDFMEGRKGVDGRALAHVTGIRTPDPGTLVIRLVQAYKPFIKTLTMPVAFVVPHEDVEASGKAFGAKPVGTGSFCFGGFRGDRSTPGRELRLLANANYFLGRPYVNRVVFHVEPTEEKRFQMFLAGELHHSTVPDPEYDNLKEKEGAGTALLTEESRLGVYYFGFNVQRPPFDNPDVRRALSHAVDREAIKKYIKIDRVDVAEGPLPPSLRRRSSVTYDQVGKTELPISFNLAKAGQLLDRAGYKLDPNLGARSGFRQIALDIPDGEEHVRIARAIQANFADLGIDARIQARSMPEHLDLLRRGESSVFRLGWVADYKDPDSFLYFNFHSRNIGQSNYAHYSNPRVDKLLDEARELTSPAAREQLYWQAEEIIVRDAPWICLFYLKTAIVRQPMVRGLDLTEFGEHMINFHEVWLELPPSAK